MYMIEINDDKFSDISENIEKGLRYVGKAMQCLDELKHSEGKSGRDSHREDRDERDEDRRYMRDSRYNRY